MDGHIQDNLENYLACLGGGRESDEAIVSRFRARLSECDEETRRAVEAFEAQASLLRTLRPAEDLSPAPGFYARVMDRIEAQRPVSPWSAMMEPFYFRRLAMASLALLLLFGLTFLSTPSAEVQVADDPRSMVPEVVLAGETDDSFGLDRDRDRDALLVNLATYQE